MPDKNVLVERILQAVRKGEGITISPADASAPTSGYMVSLPSYELRCPVSLLSRDLIAAWLTKALSCFGHIQTRYIGAWIDQGMVYLDVSIRFNDVTRATLCGKQMKQIAIWDVAAAGEIRL